MNIDKMYKQFEDNFGAILSSIQGLIIAIMDTPIYNGVLSIGIKIMWVVACGVIGTATQHYTKKYLENNQDKKD